MQVRANCTWFCHRARNMVVALYYTRVKCPAGSLALIERASILVPLGAEILLRARRALHVLAAISVPTIEVASVINLLVGSLLLIL